MMAGEIVWGMNASPLFGKDASSYVIVGTRDYVCARACGCVFGDERRDGISKRG